MDAGDTESVPLSPVRRVDGVAGVVAVARVRDGQPSARSAALLPFALFVGVLVLGALTRATPESATLFGIEGPRCPSTYVLGDAGCPGCGLTRGTALLLDGQYAAASRLQPASWLVVFFAGYAAVLYAVVLAIGDKSVWIDRLLRIGRITFLAGLLLVWLARLV